MTERTLIVSTVGISMLLNLKQEGITPALMSNSEIPVDKREIFEQAVSSARQILERNEITEVRRLSAGTERFICILRWIFSFSLK